MLPRIWTPKDMLPPPVWCAPHPITGLMWDRLNDCPVPGLDYGDALAEHYAMLAAGTSPHRPPPGCYRDAAGTIPCEDGDLVALWVSPQLDTMPPEGEADTPHVIVQPNLDSN